MNTARIPGRHRLRHFALTAVTLALCGLAAPSASATTNRVTVKIDASASQQHPISPLVYGVGMGDATGASVADLQTLNVPLTRMGGNNMTTYNWSVNARNLDNDWYFESYPYPSATAGEAGDTFVSNAKTAGATPMLTVPMIGYVAKLGSNRAILPAFSVAKYGAQQATDPYFPDAGNGVKPDGSTLVTGNNPLDAYDADSSTNEQNWINHLIAKWGRAGSGNARYYLLDNEPSIWQSTHRDIHPVGPHSTEIANDAIDYSSKIKALDPNALVVAPEEWGWTGYLYSGYDQQWAGTNGWGGPFPDHDGVQAGLDYVPWLLSQWKKAGHPVDVLSLHFYPQGGEYSDDVSDATQLLRNRSTRQLWDPNYVSESWIGTVVDLIPKMQGWVNSYYYANTPTAITEYSWGADGFINGATAQADLYGIFGRQGLSLATRWGVPAANTPTFKAMQLFRNYDFNRNGFGEIGVAATVPNPDNLSAFAALRASDGALTVMIVDKVLPDSGTTTSAVTLNLSGFSGSGNALIYQLTSANVIKRLADKAYSGTSFSLTVPSQSVTLAVLPASPGSIHEPPIANFATSPAAPTSPIPVSAAVKFSATGSKATSDPIAGYAWDFGDGGTGTGFSATHTYTSYGFFPATVTVSDNGGYIAKTTKVVPVRPTPVTSTACTVAYTNTGDWGTVFNANMHITNTGSTALNGWALDFTFPGNQTIVNLWNGVAATLGEEVLVTPASWDTTIAAGASIDVGFQANYSGTNAKPSSFTLNGMNCVVQ